MENTHFESLYPVGTRSYEIEKIVQHIKEGNSCELIGIPGVGRSGLLGLLPYNSTLRKKHFGEAQEWVHFVLVNFSELRSRTLFDVTKFLMLSLLGSLKDRKKQAEYLQVEAIFKEALSFQDELILFQGLKSIIDYLAVEREYTVIFLFDRFEEYVPMLTPEFFINLRVLRNRAKYRFSVVFSLNRPLEDLVDPSTFAEFHEYLAGNTVYMRILDLPSTEFRLRYLEKSLKRVELEKRDIKRIVALTGGHGKLTKLAAEITLADDKHDDSPTFFTSDHFLSHKRIRGACFEIWRSLIPSEQDAVKSLVAGKAEEDIVYLEHVGVVANGRLTIPLLSHFIETILPGIASKTTEIRYDAATNTIVKGDLILSDSLTAAEFRLLSYLLAHAEKIVERNEIIEVVWQEGKSIAGVTDQALDQLIFRVRKKIEDDPNTPIHLVTVKGRGLRFTP